MTSNKTPQTIEVGPTPELSLRVSIATLTRVTFSRPDDGEPMLAFEHKATVLKKALKARGGEPRVVVMAQPFGGAIRILNFSRLRSLIGGFHFDSQRSRLERDFRIFIRPADWNSVRDFSLREFERGRESDLESHPERELVEEFHDALGVEPLPSQYVVRPVGTVLENEPTGSRNVHAAGLPTVRIYRVFETQIIDPALCEEMVANSKNHPRAALQKLALEDARNGGRGRANGILVASRRRVRDAYLALPPERRREPLSFGNSILNGNVPAVLDGIVVPEYQTIS